MARATQPVEIEGIAFDALIESSEQLSADAPTYPTEDGFSVSDSIILKPLTLSMTLYLTNTPVTWRNRNGVSTSRVQDVIKKLEELYFEKKTVTITTSEKTYYNMAILSLELTKNKETGTSREIPISFQQVRIAEAKTTTIPDSYGKSGATGANAGTASTTESVKGSGSSTNSTGSEQSKGSLAYNAALSAGLFK